MLKNIEIEVSNNKKYNYTGMVNKDNKPDGFGRAIESDN